MSSEDRHSNLTIGISDLSHDEKTKVLSIDNDGVLLGFGPNYTNKSKVSFSDCELLWGL